jgi:ribosome-associated protein
MNTGRTLHSLSEGILMEDMLRNTDDLPSAEPEILPPPQALEVLLREHKGADVITLDLREAGAWTDFFVIATTASETHMDGLERRVKEFCREREIEILRRSRKPEGQEDEWRIIDLGHTVIHLMNRRTRAFYDLERLYSMAIKTASLSESIKSESMKLTN